jgi:hypothetical protein
LLESSLKKKTTKATRYFAVQYAMDKYSKKVIAMLKTRQKLSIMFYCSQTILGQLLVLSKGFIKKKKKVAFI